MSKLHLVLPPETSAPSVNIGGGRADRAMAEYLRSQWLTHIRILESIASDPEAAPKDRISAVRELMNRGFGRAPLVVEVADQSAQMDSFRSTLLDAVRSAAKSMGDTQLLDLVAVDVTPTAPTAPTAPPPPPPPPVTVITDVIDD